MTYETRWKDEIDRKWKENLEEWKKENRGQKMTTTRFQFMNNFMKEKYETPEMKRKVEEFRLSAKNDEPTEPNQIYQL